MGQGETEDSLRTILFWYGVDEGQAAIEIAKKVVEPLRRVVEAARRPCEMISGPDWRDRQCDAGHEYTWLVDLPPSEVHRDRDLRRAGGCRRSGG